VRRLAVAYVVAVLSASACAHRAAPAPAALTAPTARELPSPDAIPGTFTVRQKLTARSARGGGAFEAVLQKKPGELLLVGLTPYGSRAFLLRQTEGDVQFTSYLPRELPFPPTFILLDVHRVMDAWLGPALASGERAGEVGGERVHERWRDGKLVERTFTRLAARAGEPAGDIVITCSGDGPAGLAALVTLDNRRYGYVLTVQSFPVR
jgi:uncharacterized protein DUF3261